MGHENAEGMAHVGVHVERPVRFMGIFAKTGCRRTLLPTTHSILLALFV